MKANVMSVVSVAVLALTTAIPGVRFPRPPIRSSSPELTTSI
jgi:hypothetical protein